jgi:hypothetical protein
MGEINGAVRHGTGFLIAGTLAFATDAIILALLVFRFRHLPPLDAGSSANV